MLKKLGLIGLSCSFLANADSSWALKGEYIDNSEVPLARCAIVYDLPDDDPLMDKLMICSGTLSTTDPLKKKSKKILTAGHCVKNSKNLRYTKATVSCGNEEIPLVSQEVARGYREDPLANPRDIGVVTVEREFDVEPVLIAKNEKESRLLIEKNRETCIAFGYGEDNEGDSAVLHAIRDPFIYEQKGGKVAEYAGMYIANNNFIHGDSGASIICKDDQGVQKIVSVVSGGITVVGASMFPKIYASYDWIRSEMGESSFWDLF
jgi:hypothetical protein